MVIMYVTAVVAVSLVSVSGSAVLRRTQPVPSGPQRIAGERLYQGSKPIDKRVNWFISDSVAALPATTKYLLEDNRAITQGVYFCCGGLSFNASTGEPALGTFDPAVIKAFSDAGVATIMPTFGGDALPYAAWEKREEIADAITAWVIANNFTGVHNDWESHGDDGVDAYFFYEFWGAVAKKLHAAGKTVGTCVETAPANVSHPWTPRTLNNDTMWHSYMFSWDYVLSLSYMDVVTNMATYPMMHTTDGDNTWCRSFPNTTFCQGAVEDFVDHLTPAYKYLEQEECNPHAHTVAKWCGLKGQVQDMIDAGADAVSGQLSPGIWMNNCHISSEFPGGITAQGWTKDSFRSFLTYLDSVGVRSLDMWTSLLSKNDLDTCSWFTVELKNWRQGVAPYMS